MKQLKSLFIILLFVFTGCATSSPVMKTTSGSMEIKTYSSEKQYAVSRAYAIANKTCSRAKQSAVKINETIKYQGLLDEDVNKAVKTAKDIAWTLGQDQAAATAGQLSRDDDYEVTLEFNCE